MSNSIINVKNLTFSFSEERLLNDISFNVAQGEIITIIGRSGSGKTTLLNILSGLQPFEKGEILVNDRVLSKPTNDISYLSQTPLLLYYKTALENALLGVEIRKEIDRKVIENTSKLFNLFNLKTAFYKFPSELSGGMKQRIGIIQSIIVNANLYLLDEPFTAIDRITSLVIEDYLWNYFKAKNVSVILVTHDLEQALSISDKIILLSNESNGINFEFSMHINFIKKAPNFRRESKEFPDYLYKLLKRFNEL